MFAVFRRGWWPGPAPTIAKGRVMCSNCKYHSSAAAGWQWDRCAHPDADLGSVVRNDQRPTCADIRDSRAQCGPSGKWFEPRIRTARIDEHQLTSAENKTGAK